MTRRWIAQASASGGVPVDQTVVPAAWPGATFFSGSFSIF
jgi:hypothetical protein